MSRFFRDLQRPRSMREIRQPDIGLNEFRITVETRFGALLPQNVRASNLYEALRKVEEVPLVDWFPEEDRDD